MGGYLSGVLPGDVLLFAIAAVLLYSAHRAAAQAAPEGTPGGA